MSLAGWLDRTGRAPGRAPAGRGLRARRWLLLAIAFLVISAPLAALIPRDVFGPPGTQASDGMPVGAAGGTGAADVPASSAGTARSSLRDEVARRLRVPGLAGALDEALAASPPRNLADLVGLAAGAPLTPLPLPEPHATQPLRHALGTYAQALQVDLPPLPGLELAIAGLHLEADQEHALAQLVLAYTQAALLQRQAMAGLTPEERRFVGLDPEAAAAWLEEDPTRGWGDYEQEILRILAVKANAPLTLQAADLLARAVESSRGPLSRPGPGPQRAGFASGTLGVQEAVHGLLALPDIPAPRSPLPLEEALAALRLAYGAPPSSPLPSPALPPSLDRAIAGLVMVKAEAVRGGDARSEAAAFLQASGDARPILEAWAEVLRLRDAVPAFAEPAKADPARPADLLGGLRPAEAQRARQALASFEAARDAAIRPLGDAERQAVLRGPEVRALFGQAEWSDADAALVAAWARAHRGMEPDALRALRAAAAALNAYGGGACPASLRQEPGGCDGARQAEAESGALPSLPANRQAGEASEAPLFDDSLGSDQRQDPDDSPFCEERDGACIAPASLLRIGGVGSSTYKHVAVVHIDLGGDDTYSGEIAGTAVIAPRNAPPPPRQDGPQFEDGCVIPPTGNYGRGVCEPWPCRTSSSTICIPGLGRGSYALDVDGHDSYLTPDLPHTQGAVGPPPSGQPMADGVGTATGLGAAVGNGVVAAANNTGKTWASVLLDLAGNDQYAAGMGSQGSAIHGVGLLIDADGDDTYAADINSQGSGHLGGLGGLFDLEGNDQYRFERQASLVDATGTAAFLDAAGVDRYDSSFVVDPTGLTRNQPARALQMQGRFEGTSLGLALFMDLGQDHDTYLVQDPKGEPLDLSDIKNNQRQANGQAFGRGAGLFIDGQPVGERDATDEDRDGALQIIEIAWGTDPEDPDSHPGNVFWILAHPEAINLSDPAGTLRIDRPGPWLTGPQPPGLGPGSGIFVPGMVIGSRADDLHPDWVPLVIDLGGNDRYVGRNLGGIMTGLDGVGSQRPPATEVALLLDMGSGNDTYAPQPCEVASVGSGAWSSGTDGWLQRDGVASQVFPAACPSLGGAINGIALLGDGGGANTFRTVLRLAVDAVTPPNGPRATARIIGYGAAQGSGLFGGVGVLATWNASNEMVATVEVQAVETTPFGAAPSARSVGASQGAALGGVGIVAAFGVGPDTYRVDSVAQAVQQDGTEAGLAMGLAHGAALSGVGLFFDEGGRSTLHAEQGFAQGFAAWNATSGRPAIGLLWPGSGSNLVVGGAFSQGSAVGQRAIPNPVRAAVATGAVLDLGGDDEYRLVPPVTRVVESVGCPGGIPDEACALSQGAAGLHGLGLLLDTGGNDVYDAGGWTHAQGVGVHATGLLLDQGGHDSYQASARAQGYAFLEPILQTRMTRAVNTPAGIIVPPPTTNSVQAELLGVVEVLGALVDEGGWDRYEATAQSQGYGAAGVPPLGTINVCHQPQGSFSLWKVCTENEYQCAGVTVPAPPTTWNVCGYSGTCRGVAPVQQCETDGRQCLRVDGEDACVTPLPEDPPCVEACPSVVLGLLLDAGGSDRYDYPGAKCLPGTDRDPQVACLGDPDGDGNDWPWSQAGGSAGAVGFGLDAPAPEDAYARAAADLNAVLGQTPAGGAHVPAEVRLQITRDPEAQQVVAQDASLAGTVYLVADVSLTPPLTREHLRRVDFLVDGILMGNGTPLADGSLRFRLPWVTRVDGDAAAAPSVPDGVHRIVASALLAPPPATAAGHGPADPTPPTVESAARDQVVDNPPLVEAELSAPLVATDRGECSDLLLTLSPDAAFPGGTGSGTPGGQVRVTVHPLAGGEPQVLHDAFHAAGASTVSLAPLCAPPAPDGRYRLAVAVADTGGATASTHADLVLDSAAPTSRPLLPAVGNASMLTVGKSTVRIVWEHSDTPAGLGAGNASGIAFVRVIRIHDGSEQNLGVFGPETTSINVTSAFSGTHLRIKTIAQDRLGHVQAAPSVSQSLLDFEPPDILAVEASRTHVRPGSPVNFTVQANDGVTGVARIHLRFSEAFADSDMELGEDGVHRLTVAAAQASGGPPSETTVQFTALAFDQGGNVEDFKGILTVDSRPPQVNPQPADYGSSGQEAAARGTQVVLRARIEDAGVGTVALDPSPLQGADAHPVACAPDLQLDRTWACPAILVPAEAADGVYRLPWIVQDLAGNWNLTAASEVEVLGSPPGLTDLHVEPHHDGFTVRWRTELPAASRVLYGSTRELGGIAERNEHSLEHAVRIAGLSPATPYFLRAVAINQAGVAGSSPILQAVSGHTYNLTFPGLGEGKALRGMAEVPIAATVLDGRDLPIAITVRVQDAAGRASPQEVGSAELVQGTVAFRFDTTRIPDGPYRILLQGKRSGDTLQHASPVVRLDNGQPLLSPLTPRPGEHIALSQPQLNLSVVDPAATAPLRLETLAVTVDGVPIEVDAAWAAPWERDVARRLTIRSLSSLANGVRALDVSLVDAAGNVGHARWNITVDTLPPIPTDIQVKHLTGIAAARPGGRLRIELNATDASGAAAGSAEPGPLGASTPFLHLGGQRWSAELQVAATAPAGNWSVPLWFTDVLGTTGQTAAVQVRVDATPPVLRVATLRPDGFTALLLEASTDEPVLLQARSGAAAVGNGTAPAMQHRLRLDGLAPGTSHNVTLRLTDLAGNVANVIVIGTTRADGEAPGAVRLTAASEREGEVDLSWSAAEDNAGIAAYRVERQEKGTWRLLATVPGNATAHTDGNATAGTMVAYRVVAVDVAGIAGPPTSALVSVLALPHLLEPDVSPRSGPSDRPFTFQVWYRHPTGRVPDRAEVHFGDLRIPLLPADRNPDCRVACLLLARTHLPPAALAVRAPEVLFLASSGGEEARTPLGWTPRVTSAGEGLHAGAQAAPAPSLLLLVATLALAALSSPPLQRPPRKRI